AAPRRRVELRQAARATALSRLSPGRTHARPDRARVVGRRLARPAQERLPHHPAPAAEYPGPAGLDRVRGGALSDQPAPPGRIRRTAIRGRRPGGSGGARQERERCTARAGPGALPGRLPRRRGGGGGGGRLASGVPRPLASAVRRGPARASRSFAPAALRMTELYPTRPRA